MQAKSFRLHFYLHLLFVTALFLSQVRLAQAAVLISGNAAPYAAPGDWWSTQWDYRVALVVGANGYARADKPVEVALNFTNLLSSVGQNGAFDPKSLRLVEVGNSGVINDNVPFQFDATNNAAGTFVFLLTGNTPANGSRTYHLYFDIQGKGFTLPTFPDQTAVTTVNDEGQSSFRVQTSNATYFYQKEGGGFSSLNDANNNDWLNYHPTPASSPASTYRGIPNMVHPESKLHPGATGHTTTLVHSGPLKETIRTVINTDGDARQWDVLWEFFPAYARMIVTDIDHDYWFLYEGTPGGDLEPAKDFVVRSNGTQNLTSQSWSGDLAGEEWVYFADPTLNRSLYLISHAEDNVVDSYRPLGDANGDMTVFGFGRNGNTEFLNQTPAIYTLGLVDKTAYNDTAPLVRAAYKPLTTNVGATEQRTGGGGATITIIKDAQPDNRRNFSFSGDLGNFRLDNPKSDDGDAYGTTKSVGVNPGVYTVSEAAAPGWFVSNILCTPAANATVNLSTRQVQITSATDQNVTCTFVNQKQVLVRVQHEDASIGHTVTLYDGQGAPLGTQSTNALGKAAFLGLAAGLFTVCMDSSTTCPTVEVAAGQIAEVNFVGDNSVNAASAVTSYDAPEDADEDLTEEVALNDDLWLTTPTLSHRAYLPVITVEE